MFDIRKIQEQAIYEAVKNESNEHIAREVVYGKDESGKAENNGTWVNSTMKRLRTKFDKAATKKIRMKCQCGYGMDKKLELVKELVELSSSLEELGNLPKAKDAGLFYEDGDLYLKFDFCSCPMLANVDKLDSDTWCQCTTGYSKVLFEKALQCEVDVELLKSIKMGDEKCLMKIIPQGTIW
jgi:predicted hydrocarbon binding protein